MSLPPTLDDGFAWEEVDHHFQVIDRSALTVKTKHLYKLRCTRDSRFAIVRYEWTGHGPERPPKVSRPAGVDPGEPLVRTLGTPLVHGGTGRYLVVDLGRVYAKGESTSFEVDHFFIDTSQSFLPQMSHLGLHGQMRVSINVYLPPGFAKSVVSMEKFSSGALVKDPALLDGLSIRRNGVDCLHYSFTTSQVASGRKYGIHWEHDV